MLEELLYSLSKQWPPSFSQVAGLVISLLWQVLCEEHHKPGGAGCKLLTPQPDGGQRSIGGLGVFLNSIIAGAPLKETDLPGYACHNLSVLNSARGTAWGHSLCLGAQRAGSFLTRKKKKKGGRKITVSCLRQSNLRITASQDLAVNNALISQTYFYFFVVLEIGRMKKLSNFSLISSFPLIPSSMLDPQTPLSESQSPKHM